MRPDTEVDNRSSSLLSRDENELVFRLLGNRCQTLATGVVQVFITDPPDHSAWKRMDCGVLCLVKDNQRRSYFFRLFCLTRAQMIWEHEVYNSMDYKSPKSWFHVFEGQDCIVAFNFASEEDARTVKVILDEKLEAKKRRERRSLTKSSLQTSRSSLSTGIGVNTGPSHAGSTSHLVNGSFVPSPRQQHRNVTSSKKKDKDSKRRLTKADIGPPKNFRHVSHVGWDPNKGFDLDNVEDPQLKLFFDKAGVSDSQLQDRETREFIYDFINRHGGIDAVKDEVVYPQPSQAPMGPPPVPARSAPTSVSGQIQYQTRSAPPPPPSRTAALPPPPPPTQPPVAPGPPPPPPPTRTMPRQDVTHSQGAPVAPPPPPAISAVCVPPPPPPPMSMIPTDPDGQSAPHGIPNDNRSALLESIRSGKTLKHVEVDNKRPNSSSDSRGDLLDQIRQGIELKSVQPTPKSVSQSTPKDGLAGALARALAERSRAIHSDTSGSSDDDDEEDEEWED